MWVVYNLAHKNQTIRSLQGGKLRILGCFGVQDQAWDFVKQWASQQPDLETRVSPVKQFRVLSKEFLDLSQQEAFIEKQLKEYTSLRDKKIQDVLQRAQLKEAPALDSTQTVIEIEKNKKSVDEGLIKNTTQEPQTGHFHQTNILELDQNNETQKCPLVTNGLTLANQNFVAVAILPDDFKDKSFDEQEPCFAFFGTSDTEENLQKLITKEVSSQQHGPNESLPWSYFPVVGIRMQEFVSLAKQQEMSTQRRYHDDNLQKLWEAHQTNGSP